MFHDKIHLYKIVLYLNSNNMMDFPTLYVVIHKFNILDLFFQFTFQWPTRSQVTSNPLWTKLQTLVSKFVDQDHNSFHHGHLFDHVTTIKEEALNSTTDSTESNLQAAFSVVENASTILGDTMWTSLTESTPVDQIKTSGEIFTTSSNISSIATTTDLGLTDNFAYNQTATGGILNPITLVEKFFTTLSSII